MALVCESQFDFVKLDKSFPVSISKGLFFTTEKNKPVIFVSCMGTIYLLRLLSQELIVLKSITN